MSTITWLLGPDGAEGKTWNPVVGCTRVSDGCSRCYAMGVAHRKMSPQHVGLTKLRPRDASRPGVDWTGEVRTLPERLGEPLHWRKPRRVFVNSMSDLFHPSVPFEFIAAVFGVMAASEQHTYLVLTKRPREAERFFTRVASQRGQNARSFCSQAASKHVSRRYDFGAFGPWPLPNVHLGVSAEDQATFDERVPLLLECPAAVRWVSAEPLLGPIDIDRGSGWVYGLDWIVVGGESGGRARPYDVSWPRAVIEQCRMLGVPVFHKQVGARPMMRADSLEGRRAGDHPEREWPEGTRFTTAKGHKGTQWQGRWARLHDKKGEDMDEWPADLRVRQYPKGAS